MKRSISILAAMAAAGFGACATAIPHLTEQQLSLASAKWPGVEKASLEHGRSLYVTRCSACHEAPPPNDLKGEQLIGEMAERAHLSAEEQQLVIRFVEASKLLAAPVVAITPEPARSPTAVEAAN